MCISIDNKTITKKYKSKSQIARILSENWVKQHMYCPFCIGIQLQPFNNNKKVSDFYCDKCKNEFQLKSYRKASNTILGSAYQPFIDAIESNNVPNFLLLLYDANKCIETLTFIPNYYITKSIVHKRNELSPSAKRSGWVGYTLNLNLLPTFAQIKIIDHKNWVNKTEVRDTIKKFVHVKNTNGWYMTILSCIHQLNKKKFTLSELYEFEDYLKYLYPNNKHIKAKIRQQLQFLRDNKILLFIKKGYYEYLL